MLFLEMLRLNLAGSKDSQQRNAPFFTVARFGPGTTMIFLLLIIFAAILYRIGYWYIAVLPISTSLIIFFVKSFEMIQETKFDRKIVGQKCLVIKKVSRVERGIVRIYREDGDLDPELWSAEGLDGIEIEENKIAKIAAVKGIIVLVEHDL